MMKPLAMLAAAIGLWSLCSPGAQASGLENDRWRVELAADRTIRSLSLKRGETWDTVSFRHDRHAGPKWYGQAPEGIERTVDYRLDGDRLAVIARIHNGTGETYAPEKAGLTFGLSNYMAAYPAWNEIYFPTMLRCEKTHFWGYLMNPNGRIIGIASPDSIASWSLRYNAGYGSGIPGAPFWGHRVYTFDLDLLCAGPLPERHPQTLDRLEPGETRSWTILLTDIPSLADVPASLSALSGHPFENIEIMPAPPRPWSWYLQRAREAALKDTQKASWNCENWYGFYSAYLAHIYFPDAELLAKTDERFGLVMAQMYDTVTMAPLPGRMPDRIQNHSTTIGMYVDRYRATGSLRDLEKAALLADWIIDNAQVPDGSYRRGKTHYTSVIYVAKSLMELYLRERELPGAVWQERYLRHFNSAKRAVDQLMLGVGAMDTEGELTFEDGMISCSALQIAAFALQLEQSDPAEAARYTKTAIDLLRSHDCLTQLVVPDERMRGGTLRFWEAQYDVMTGHNMLTSPHGWTSWRTYATYYVYLLTGEVKWLIQTMNALGSSVRSVNSDTGELYWAFVVDPQVRTVQTRRGYDFPDARPDSYNANQHKAEEGETVPVVIGEQYVPMVAGWFTANSSDNDVHEHFKCLEEIALTSAHVAEREDGTFVAFNCHLTQNGPAKLTIVPNESVVSQVHVNLRRPARVRIEWPGARTRTCTVAPGMHWLSR